MRLSPFPDRRTAEVHNTFSLFRRVVNLLPKETRSSPLARETLRALFQAVDLEGLALGDGMPIEKILTINRSGVADINQEQCLDPESGLIERSWVKKNGPLASLLSYARYGIPGESSGAEFYLPASYLAQAINEALGQGVMTSEEIMRVYRTDLLVVPALAKLFYFNPSPEQRRIPAKAASQPEDYLSAELEQLRASREIQRLFLLLTSPLKVDQILDQLLPNIRSRLSHPSQVFLRALIKEIIFDETQTTLKVKAVALSKLQEIARRSEEGGFHSVQAITASRYDGVRAAKI